MSIYRVRARKYFSFATTFANLIFFVPFSKSLSQGFGHILPETFMFKVNFLFFSVTVNSHVYLLVKHVLIQLLLKQMKAEQCLKMPFIYT